MHHKLGVGIGTGFATDNGQGDKNMIFSPCADLVHHGLASFPFFPPKIVKSCQIDGGHEDVMGNMNPKKDSDIFTEENLVKYKS